ncbi:MAG: hypothetical protein J7L32_00395 [Thermoplasmata archaeon]|nr:hypothetical protein [Thermoplasmata archaeon]
MGRINKKTGYVLMLVMLLTISTFSGAMVVNGYTSTDTKKPGFDGYTHTVLGEMGTATWCGYCPTVSGYLWNIYSAGTRDFHYVSLVADKNGEANDRCDELGLTGYPTVFYDGGYRRIVGAGAPQSTHEAIIDECGQRSVPDIDLTVDVTWNGDTSMTIAVNAQNNEVPDTEITDGPTGLINDTDPTFSWSAAAGSSRWHIRVYITEIVSRWNDADGHPYHFALLGFALNKNINVPGGETYQETTTWDGSAHGYDDITQDNIKVIATIFDTNGYAVETAAAYPTLKSRESSTGLGEITFSYKLEGYDSDWSEWTTDTTVTYHDVPDGTYTFKVKAKSGTGEDPTPAERTFQIDATPPETTITSGPTGDITTKDVEFEWTGNDAVTQQKDLMYSYKLEGYDADWSGWTLSKTVSYTNLPAGSYTFKVRAIDKAGNYDLTPATRSFTVLRAEPYTSIVSGPEGFVNSGDVTFEWTGTDDSTPTQDLVYSYKLEGYDSEWSEWTSGTTKTYTSLGEGSYTFMVKAKDTDGYVDPEGASRSFTVDTVPPVVEITSPLKNHLYLKGLSIPFFGTWIIATSVDVEATASDDSGVSHVEFYIDNSLKADDNSLPYSWNWDEKTFGQRTIKVVAYDNAGNSASDETTVWRFF